ncbi:MAG TPA: hypothetical protein VEJ63_10855, partial [Planctomycetota bacterium]|nr:hypothetical protein [Planctomycetota bacterium]
TRLELADMFLGKCPAVPTQKWPHPTWRSEWRLWLAIWLEQKGQKKEAHDIAKPALDSRYGNTHSQPALRRLVERTAR